MTAPDPSPLESVAASAANAQDAPDLRGGDAPDSSAVYDSAELGDECPITPLGAYGRINWFLNYRGELIDLGTKFEKGEVMQLFGTRLPWAEAKWPRWKKVGEKKGADGRTEPILEREPAAFDQADAQRALILACAKRPPFDPTGRVRGRGAHRGGDGELILHCGDAVLVGGRRGVRGRLLRSAAFKPGLVGGFVYPTLMALPRPAETEASVNVGMAILSDFETWKWKRPEIAPYLLLGWMVAANAGGALKVRPSAWITGPSGAGKTTLQDYLRLLLGEWGIFTEDATEAGLRQSLDQDTLAVMFDEIEAGEDNQEVMMKVVRLARLSYSGSSSLRGSADHKAKSFAARSCFLFSSIHHHELPVQDRNRIAILNLAPFPPKTRKFVLPALAREWGDQLRRRLIEQWHRFDETLAKYQEEMLEQGYSPREQDTYGTLLASADLALYGTVPEKLMGGAPSRCEELVRKLGLMVDAVRAEAEDTAERCLKHLASHRLPALAGSNQETVSRWIQRSLIAIHNKAAENRAAAKIAMHGLRLVHLKEDHAKGNGQGGLEEAYLSEGVRIWLAVANKTNKGTAEIFKASMWETGIWTQSLALVDGAILNKKSRFGGGPPEGCILVPLDEMIDVAAAIEEANRLKSEPELPQGS